MLPACQFLTILTFKSLSRAGVVQILSRSTSKSAPNPRRFNDFDFQIALARRRGANFVDILDSRSFATPVFRTYLCELSKRQNYGKTQHFAQFLPAKTSLLSNIYAARPTGNFQYSRKLELLNFLWLKRTSNSTKSLSVRWNNRCTVGTSCLSSPGAKFQVWQEKMGYHPNGARYRKIKLALACPSLYIFYRWSSTTIRKHEWFGYLMVFENVELCTTWMTWERKRGVMFYYKVGCAPAVTDGNDQLAFWQCNPQKSSSRTAQIAKLWAEPQSIRCVQIHLEAFPIEGDHSTQPLSSPTQPIHKDMSGIVAGLHHWEPGTNRLPNEKFVLLEPLKGCILSWVLLGG